MRERACTVSWWCIGLWVVALLTACGPTAYTVRGEYGTVPFEGELRVSEVDDGERRYDLSVGAVPEPWRLKPGTHHYVAWLISDTRGPFKLAKVDYDDLSRRARLDERAGFEGRVFRVTAEVESWVREPSAQVLFDLPLWPKPAPEAE